MCWIFSKIIEYARDKKDFYWTFSVICKLYYLNSSAIESNYISDNDLIILFNHNDLIIIKFSVEFPHSSCVYTDLAYQWASVLSFASECKDVTCLVQAILVIHNLRFEAPLVEQISEVCSDRKSIAERLLWEGFFFSFLWL